MRERGHHTRAPLCTTEPAAPDASARPAARHLTHPLPHVQAFAKALISGGCTALSATAATEVDIVIKAFPNCKCAAYVYVCENGKCAYVQKDPYPWPPVTEDATQVAYVDKHPFLFALGEGMCSAGATDITYAY